MENYAHSFKDFESDVRDALAKSHHEREIIDDVRPLLSSLLKVKDLVPDQYRQPLAHKYGQYLLYKPEDEAFVVVAFAWGPYQDSPIHDHLVWGLVGIYEGQLDEIRYRRLDDDANPDQAVLEEFETVTGSAGEISFVYPPKADIHRVINRTNQLAISIHIYGHDIGKHERHVYDMETGAIKHVVTPHVNKTPIYSSN